MDVAYGAEHEESHDDQHGRRRRRRYGQKERHASRTGYRATVRIPDRATQERINAAGVEAYHAAVEQLVARAQAVRLAPIKEQMAEAAKQAGKENAARPAPAKAKEARNDR